MLPAMTPLALYVSASMHAWCPVADHLYVEAAPITEARFADIAQTIADVADDPIETPAFIGADGRLRTAVLLAAIASYESGCFRAAVQFCQVGGDNSRAWGLYQSHAGRARVCWSQHDAAVIALQQVRDSFHDCAGNTAAERLASYCSYDCEHGRAAARKRYGRAADWIAAHPFPPVTP
jgi:hypothetical protein